MIKAGTVISNTYQIIGEIGSGGGGTVYKAYHLRLKKYVVVKRINDSWLNIMDRRAEVDIIKNLKHEYLPQAYDFIQIDNNVYTVMDFVEGASFDKYIKQGYTFTQQQLIFWTKELCQALIYLHSRNPKIIHSDIKPANIMLTPQGNICLIDFNVSMNSSPTSIISATSTGYASPEQYLNLRPIGYASNGVPLYNFGMLTPLDERSDIYSLGATLYHMMTGKRVPKNFEERIPITRMNVNYSEPFVDIVEKMLQYDPNNRYQNAGQVLNDLNNIKKIDKSYVKYRHTQLAVNIVFSAVLVTSVLLAVGGRLTMNQEYENTYQNNISLADNYTQKENYEQATEYYNKAMEMYPESIKPYYGILYTYSEQYDFDKVIDYGTDTLAAHEFEINDKTTNKDKADFYYVLANAYFEKEDYDNAIKYYTFTTDLYKENPEYYRDYAIAAARHNEVESAKNILETAKELNLSSDSIDLVNAEIAYAEERYSDSIKFFKSAISASKSDTLTQRAYLYMARAYKKQGDYDSEIDLLSDNESVFNTSRLKAAKKMMGEAYVAKANSTNSEYDRNKYCNKAIELYKQIEAMGNSTKETEMNLAAAYLLNDDFDNAEQVLLNLSNEYSNDSSIYARLAINEAAKQGKIERTSRDYSKFSEYYDKAEELDKQNKVNGTSGSDIAEMEETMKKLQAENWIRK